MVRRKGPRKKSLCAISLSVLLVCRKSVRKASRTSVLESEKESILGWKYHDSNGGQRREVNI